MSSDLIQQAVSNQQALTQQKIQVAVIKAQNEMTETMINMLTESIDNARTISPSTTHGQNIDISI